MDIREVIARFEAERQALALMDHPNIARVLDAGATQTKHPYFVMALVRGVPITDYCDQRKLSIRERLKLFVSICHGVQHAHQKGIIHRDIKPSNVLVELHEDTAVPKIIDIGVAKATSQQLTEHTVHTLQAQMIGTPLYMSPEQAQKSGLDVDKDLQGRGRIHVLEPRFGAATFKVLDLPEFAENLFIVDLRSRSSVDEVHDAVIDIFECVINAVGYLAHLCVGFLNDLAANAVHRRVAVNSGWWFDSDVVMIVMIFLGLAKLQDFDAMLVVEKDMSYKSMKIYRLELQNRCRLIVPFVCLGVPFGCGLPFVVIGWQ